MYNFPERHWKENYLCYVLKPVLLKCLWYMLAIFLRIIRSRNQELLAAQATLLSGYIRPSVRQS